MLTTVKPKMRRLALVRSVNISIAAWIHIPIALRTSSATRCIGEEKVTQNNSFVRLSTEANIFSGFKGEYSNPFSAVGIDNDMLS